MTKPQAQGCLLLLLSGSIALIWNACSSFGDYTDKSDAESFRAGSAPCQVRASLSDTPFSTRQTKYGPVCAK